VRFIPVRHEESAAFMADAYGRYTGRPGVCLSTLGPGATNLTTGVADAYLDRAPMVALTGQVGVQQVHKETHQYIDVVEMLRPITKWNATVGDPRVVPETVRKRSPWPPPKPARRTSSCPRTSWPPGRRLTAATRGGCAGEPAYESLVRGALLQAAGAGPGRQRRRAHRSAAACGVSASRPVCVITTFMGKAWSTRATAYLFSGLRARTTRKD
jgi:acetolactate synthase-1/2/3 large subunit